MLSDELVFVAIKNGEHSALGKIFTTVTSNDNNLGTVNITEIFDLIHLHFKEKT